MSIGGHQSQKSLKEEWLTPPDIIGQLGPFDCDPCAPVIRPWDTAKKHYTILDDGLKQPWNGVVWCNPPYNTKAEKWLSRLADHGNGIALIFARTETRWFVSEVWKKASALLFIEGRLHFHHVGGQKAAANAGAPSVLVAYGAECTERLAACLIPGAFIFLNQEAAA